MAKKGYGNKAKKSASIKNTLEHYLQLYFISVVAAVVVYIGGSTILYSHPACANSRTCQSDLTEKIDNSAIGYFQGKEVIPPKIDPSQDFLKPSVLGTNDPSAEKHIYINLEKQQLSAFEGTNQVMQTFISSGKWNPTPVGNFHVWTKLRATRMAGGEGADAYDLPNVPYVMYFYSDYGLHGAYWHNNFGHKMSHGCVNMRIVDARDLFNWAEIGTPVSVCKQFTAPDNCIQN